MIGFATIRKEGFPKRQLDQQRWRSLVGEFPELRRMDFLAVGSERIPAPDSAELVEDDRVVGAFIWDNGQVYVDGPYTMFPLAKGITDRFFRVYNLFATGPMALFSSVQETCEWRRKTKKDFPDRLPYPIYPERHGILPWGNDENGHDYYWFTKGATDD